MPILPKVRDPRLVTIRRGGTLSDDDHHALAEWSVVCVERVLDLFESAAPGDTRPREALDLCRAWISGEVPMTVAHNFAFVANAAGRERADAPRFVALAAGQAVAVAHVAAHDLGAAAYAIRAVVAATSGGSDDANAARLRERNWQRTQLPPVIQSLVLEDQAARSSLCWNVFDD